MKIVSAILYALNIPFIEAFNHGLSKRRFSDSIIIKLTAEDGTTGFGEGVARPYVTGETVEKSSGYIKNVLFPAIKNVDFPDLEIENKSYNALSFIGRCLPNNESPGIIAWNAAKCAVELALIDCLLKKQKVSLNQILPARSNAITYSGVIPLGSAENTRKYAKYFKSLGLKYLKIKVNTSNKIKPIAIAREIMGPITSIRLDANGAFNVKEALKFISSAEKYDIECIEQPISRGNLSELSQLRSNSPIPIMVDESLVTIDDARMLIEHNACDYFNLRISKCGGLFPTLLIAGLARQAGLKMQLGCQVGETAILSAAGRHVAAHLEGLRFVEGSYGRLLLAEDLAKEDIQFGPGGIAPALTGEGLGIVIEEDRLRQYAKEVTMVE